MTILLLFLPLLLAAALLVQVRQPTRWLGRPFLWVMNRSHSGLTDWGLQHLAIEERFRILDVGCGGGRTIQKLSAIASEGRVYGVDLSAESVAMSRRVNARAIAAGQVEIRRASVANLPFPEGRFDLVTAVETHYYWPDQAAGVREILRVLKPGGALCIIAETYRSGGHSRLGELAMKPLRVSILSVDEHRELLVAAGYAEVELLEEPRQGWICARGRKPA